MRDINRFYADKFKRKAYFKLKHIYKYADKHIDPYTIGITARDRKKCSKGCCGNVRFYEGITRQEQLANFNLKEQLNA